MLSWASSEFVAAITFLLPGFVAAWVFYGLTAHPRRDHFERLIQAVIFTGIVHALTYGVQWSLGKATAFATWGAWTIEVATCWSIVNALVVGVVVSVLANYGWLHRLLQILYITKRTSYPSEWFSAFNGNRRWIVLHLEGERRMHGWPEEWPDSGDSGHFVMCNASWMLDNNELVPIHAADQLVIPVGSVKMVERLKTEKEMNVSSDEVLAAAKKTASLYEQEEHNGKQSARSVPDSTPATASRTEGSNGQATTTDGSTAAAAPAPAPAPAPQRLTKGQRKRLRIVQKKSQ